MVIIGLSSINYQSDYNKIEDDISKDFYMPSLEKSIKYDRISGYFSSSIFAIAWQTMKNYIGRGGTIRIICSPKLSPDDAEAVIDANNSITDKKLHELLSTEIIEMLGNPILSKPSKAFAGLISMGIVEVRIAKINSISDPNIKRMFHDKVGIFYDEIGDYVGFRGSMNETYNGLSNDGNIESIDVFPSWLDERDRERVNKSIKYFNKLWNDEFIGVEVKKLPDSIIEILRNVIKDDKIDDLIDDVIKDDFIDPWSLKNDKIRKVMNHQYLALENWKRNNYKGILQHATGSGKTYTALCAIQNQINLGKVSIILVPSRELLYQWQEEVSSLFKQDGVKVLLCGDNNNSWRINGSLYDWTMDNPDVKRIIIAVMDTAASVEFTNLLQQGEHLFIVADEVHNIGSEVRSRFLNIICGPRLGLSATPTRYGDTIGTNKILSFFGKILQPIFTIKDAMNLKVLTKYYYYPERILLEDHEQVEWEKITTRIKKKIAMNYSNKTETEVFESADLKLLLIQRSRIVKNAINKIAFAKKIIDKNYTYGQRWIIYCDNQEQLTSVINLMKGNYDIYDYHSAMTGDRKATLRYFENSGGIIVSIKCLDEGVDIPNATHAIILASSKNPREFIQRRGRILRKAPNKLHAFLYDAIVVPKYDYGESTINQVILGSELSRAVEFGSDALNPSSTNRLIEIAIDYDIDLNNIKDGGYEDD